MKCISRIVLVCVTDKTTVKNREFWYLKLIRLFRQRQNGLFLYIENVRTSNHHRFGYLDKRPEVGNMLHFWYFTIS